MLTNDLKFVHGLNLRNEHSCHNLSIAGTLWTPNFPGMVDPGLNQTFRHIDDISLEELRSEGPTGNAVAPRVARYVIRGAVLERGLTWVDGYDRPVGIPDGTRIRILESRDAELAMEAGRRKYAAEGSLSIFVHLARGEDARRRGAHSSHAGRWCPHLHSTREDHTSSCID